MKSHNQRHTITQGIWFSDAKDLGEIPMASTQRWWVEIGDFRQISCYISETVQYMDM